MCFLFISNSIYVIHWNIYYNIFYTLNTGRTVNIIVKNNLFAVGIQIGVVCLLIGMIMGIIPYVVK